MGTAITSHWSANQRRQCRNRVHDVMICRIVYFDASCPVLLICRKHMRRPLYTVAIDTSYTGHSDPACDYWSAMPVKRLSKTRTAIYCHYWSHKIYQIIYRHWRIPSLTLFAVHRASIGCLRCIHILSRNILFIFDFILLLVSFSHVPLSPCEAEITNLSPLVFTVTVNCIQLCLNLGETYGNRR